MTSWRRTGGITALLALGFWSCCDERSTKVSDMSGRLDFAFDWAVKLKFDASMRFDFNGDFDFSSWAKFSAATSINLKFQFGGGSAYRRRISADIDDDGVDESVEVLAFASGDPAAPDRVMVSWRGDDFTFDSDRCYVMWWEGNTLELLNGRCNSAEPALHCQMTEGNSSTMSCNVCAGTGVCSACNASLVSECIAEGERKLSSNSGVGGSAGAGGVVSAGAGGTIATWIGTAGTVGEAGATVVSAPAAGSGGASIGIAAGGSTQSASVGTSISVEFDTCQMQVRSLAGTATGCNRTLRDANVLCSERLTEVNVCYVAVQGAGLFVSECSVLGSQACQGVLP